MITVSALLYSGFAIPLKKDLSSSKTPRNAKNRFKTIHFYGCREKIGLGTTASKDPAVKGTVK
jgi:hypothetical protein